MPKLLRISDDAVSATGLFSSDDGVLFEIHPPQRRFKWRKIQIEQLWEDITQACDGGRESYFLGSLLLVDLENGRVSVIDGQQRITTISILLAVLRDYCDEFPQLRERASGIHRLLARVDNDGRPVGSMVLTLQEPDKQVYVDLVKERGSTKNITAQPELLLEAGRLLKENVRKYLNVPDAQEKLRNLCEYIQTSIKVLPIGVRSEGEGYLVFDTSNTRGLRLSPAEQLKARLAAVARESVDLADELIERWNAAASRLDGAGLPIDSMNEYLHAIRSSTEGHISKRSLGRIPKERTTPEGLREFVDDLTKYVDSFLAVVAPTKTTALTEDLKDLRALNSQSVGFLTMTHKHSTKRFEEAVGLVLSLQIRNITFGPHSPNTYERNWSDWARLVRDGDPDRAFEEIRSRLVNDSDFRASFITATAVSSATVRHVLRRLDPINRPGSGVQVVGVDVEHVLPKSVVAKLIGDKSLGRNVEQWIEDLGYKIPETPEQKKELGEKLEQWLNMLGNQALLNDKANRVAKDRPFSEKKSFYGGQALKLTKSLENQEQWREKQISERQKKMAEEAPSIWGK